MEFLKFIVVTVDFDVTEFKLVPALVCSNADVTGFEATLSAESENGRPPIGQIGIADYCFDQFVSC